MKPFVMQCNDYHDFSFIQDGINCAINQSVKFKEITLLYDDEEEYDPYWAIFYVGKCPIKNDRIKVKDLGRIRINEL